MQIFKTKYLVIGSGPGGVTIGHHLSKNNEGVIIIEEGNQVKSVPNSISTSLMKLWQNNGITPVLGDKNLILGQGKCVGGGSTINAGLIWKTPEFILDKWKKKYKNTFFENFNQNYKEIQKKLFITEDDNKLIPNKHTERIINGSKKLKWSYLPVPKSLKDNEKNKDTFGGSVNSLIYNYIEEFKKNGGQIIPNLFLYKINYKYNEIESVICIDKKRNLKIKIYADYYFLCCGSIMTPFILKKNKIIKKNISSQFHSNLRFIPIFKNKIDIKEKTFATHEVNEFQKDGLMVIPSEYKKKYLSSIISSYSNKDINKILESIDYGGLYVAQLKMSSEIKINSVNFIKEPILTNYLDNKDKDLINFSINKVLKLLFESGAEEIYLPYGKSYKINKDEINKINNLKLKFLNMISVHLMSSLPLFNNENINESGKIRNLKNLFISDGSVLPENIGQSPQGTIMLFSKEIANRFSENEK